LWLDIDCEVDVSWRAIDGVEKDAFGFVAAGG
jgi:hypothetical protein